MRTSNLLILSAALLTCTLSRITFAQQSTELQSQPQQTSSPASSQASVTPATLRPPSESHERILGVIPAFDVTDLRRAPSLTPGQKFKLFARQAFDPVQWVAAGAQAGLSQAHNTFPGYGQGAAGYGKRYGAAMADITDREFLSNFLFPVVLKQDPRYFRSGRGSIPHRFLYALEQEFWGKTDRGTRQFNFSKVLGAFAAKGISNLYYPPDDRGFGITMRRSALTLASGMASNLGAEFWPDIRFKVFHR